MLIQEIIGILFIISVAYLIISGTILGIVWIKTYKILNPQSGYFKLALNHIQFIKDFFFGLKEPTNAASKIQDLLNRYKNVRRYCMIGIGIMFLMLISLIIVSV